MTREEIEKQATEFITANLGKKSDNMFADFAIEISNATLDEVIQQVEAYPMFPDEKKSWVEYLKTLKII